MRFRHTFAVDAPLALVRAFHTQPASLATITPPPLRVSIQGAPESLGEGADLAFRLCLGPLAIPWQARFEQVSPTSFVDRQLRGPFRYWIHRHSFSALGEGVTEVRDEVEAGLRPHPLWGPLGLAMWLGMPLLFAYRARRTRALLAGRQQAGRRI